MITGWLRIVSVTAVVACGGSAKPIAQAAPAARPDTIPERMLAMLPQGAQVIVEIDLARFARTRSSAR